MTQLQRLLAAAGKQYADIMGQIDADFGPRTEAAVRTFQAQHHDMQSQPLEVDGIVGPETMFALGHPVESASTSDVRFYQRSVVLHPPLTLPLPERLIRIAVNEHNLIPRIVEDPPGSNDGPPSKYMNGRNREQWCSDFVSWCLRQALLQMGHTVEQVKDIDFPYSGDLNEWLLNHGGRRLYQKLQRGDVFWFYSSSASPPWQHVGLIEAAPAGNQAVITIEGNVSNAVSSRFRSVNSLSRVVRLPVDIVL